jgi:hypothetical protein
LLGDADEGLKRFSTYLATKLAVTAQQNLRIALETAPTDKRAPVLYADALTLLFEGVARVIEIHQPLLETFYGKYDTTYILRNGQTKGICNIY